MNNISFSGKTNIIFDNKIYDRLVSNPAKRHITNVTNSLNQDYRISLRRTVLCDPNLLEGPSVILANENVGTFFNNAVFKMSEILNYIDELKKSSIDKLTAWIIGGQNSAQTTKNVNLLADILCDRPDIDASILAGQKQVVPNITLRPTSEKFNIILGLPKKENLEGVLDDCFEIVELNNTVIS